MDQRDTRHNHVTPNWPNCTPLEQPRSKKDTSEWLLRDEHHSGRQLQCHGTKNISRNVNTMDSTDPTHTAHNCPKANCQARSADKNDSEQHDIQWQEPYPWQCALLVIALNAPNTCLQRSTQQSSPPSTQHTHDCELYDCNEYPDDDEHPLSKPRDCQGQKRKCHLRRHKLHQPMA